MKFNPIGTTFKEGDVVLKVVESKDNGKTCTGCWYNSRTGPKNNQKHVYTHSCYVHGHICTPALRKDKKQVVFTIVQ